MKADWTGAFGAMPYDAKLARQLTFRSRFDEEVRLARHVDSTLMVPRALVEDRGEDRRVLGNPLPEVISKFKPRTKEQARVVEQSVALFQQDRDHIVQAPTGFGKTVIGSEIALQMGRQILVLVTKSDIVSQWRDAFCMITGLPKDSVGLLQGDVCDVINKPMVIGMVQSVCKPGRYPGWVYKQFGFVISDEVHRMGADVFSQAMWLFPAKHRMGLSATPDRRDGKGRVFKAHIGDVLVRAKAKALPFKVIRRSTGWEVPRVTRKINGVWKTIPMPHNSGKTMHMSKDMCKDDTRNRMAMDFVAKAYKKGRSIVVFSDIRQDYLDHLKMLLQLAGVPGADISTYVGGMKDSAKDTAIAKPVVLTTYKMTSEATDVPWWDTCVLMHPKADVVQIVGRIRREYEGKKMPVVFDLVDSNSDVFSGYAKARLRWYQLEGAVVV
jgi:superfamily II DNA or RNA helicase